MQPDGMGRLLVGVRRRGTNTNMDIILTDALPAKFTGVDDFFMTAAHIEFSAGYVDHHHPIRGPDLSISEIIFGNISIYIADRLFFWRWGNTRSLIYIGNRS